MSNEQWMASLQSYLTAQRTNQHTETAQLIPYKKTEVVNFWIDSLLSKGKSPAEAATIINKAINMRKDALMNV